MKKHVQTDSEWQEEMSQKIIDEIQCELYLDMPFMKIALSTLLPKANEQLYSMATDGTYIYYNPIRLIDIFKKNGMYLNRAYLHSVLHCLFFHLWTRGERDEFLWNTACDIMVEYTIDTMEKKSTKRILSYIRKTTYERLKKEHIAIAPGALYAWIYIRRPDFYSGPPRPRTSGQRPAVQRSPHRPCGGWPATFPAGPSETSACAPAA